MKKCAVKIIPSAIIFLIGLLIFISIPTQVKVLNESGANTRTLPYISSIIIMFGSIFDILVAIKQTSLIKKETKVNKKEELTGYCRVLLLFFCIILWAILLRSLGYIIITVLLSSSIMVLAGNRKLYQIIVMSVLLSCITYYIFRVLLNINLPMGILYI